MSKIDILGLAPTTVSRDLKGRYVLLYGAPKVGKTTLSAQFPKALLCAFEHGYGLIGGAYALDITSWGEFKQVVRQLKKPEAKERYNTIVIDTAQIAYDLAERYVCANNGVTQVSEIPYGGGWSKVAKEYDNTLREITQLGYGLVLIAHAKTKEEEIRDGVTKTMISPDLNKRCYAIANNLVDIIGYIEQTFNEDGTSERWLYTRRTPTIMAGSRFPYLEPKIKLGYQELVDAIGDAIEKQEKLDGVKVVDHTEKVERESLDYLEIRRQAAELWTKLIDANEDNYQLVTAYIKTIMGRTMKLSEITPEQVEAFDLILQEMQRMAEEQNIKV